MEKGYFKQKCQASEKYVNFYALNTGCYYWYFIYIYFSCIFYNYIVIKYIIIIIYTYIYIYIYTHTSTFLSFFWMYTGLDLLFFIRVAKGWKSSGKFLETFQKFLEESKKYWKVSKISTIYIYIYILLASISNKSGSVYVLKWLQLLM